MTSAMALLISLYWLPWGGTGVSFANLPSMEACQTAKANLNVVFEEARKGMHVEGNVFLYCMEVKQ